MPDRPDPAAQARCPKWIWHKEAKPQDGLRTIVRSDMVDRWGTYDAKWGGGRGAWFSDQGQILIRVTEWQADPAPYLVWRGQNETFNWIPLR